MTSLRISWDRKIQEGHPFAPGSNQVAVCSSQVLPSVPSVAGAVGNHLGTSRESVGKWRIQKKRQPEWQAGIPRKHLRIGRTESGIGRTQTGNGREMAGIPRKERNRSARGGNYQGGDLRNPATLQLSGFDWYHPADSPLLQPLRTREESESVSTRKT